MRVSLALRVRICERLAMQTTTAPTAQARLLAEVRAEMARQGITRQMLASATDMSPWAVGRRLSGAADLSFGEVESIAAALGLRTSELILRAESAA